MGGLCGDAEADPDPRPGGAVGSQMRDSVPPGGLDYTDSAEHLRTWRAQEQLSLPLLLQLA